MNIKTIALIFTFLVFALLSSVYSGAVALHEYRGENAGQSEALAQLQDIRRIVFLGDSVTQAGEYVVDIECWLLAHGGTIEILNLGLGSETAAALPETDKGHWWGIEYAGWKGTKAPMPLSPGDGPRGKGVVLLKAGDHLYWTAYVKGFTVIAKAYEMDVKIFNGNWNMDLQAQQTDQAINERPDMIIFAPVDATACTPLLRRIHGSDIPCITSNTIPCDAAMKYCIAWTGPDDWMQFRMLARHFANALGKKGGYAIVRHMPGSSCFFSRTFAPITELRAYAPEMEMLAMDTANLEAEATMQLVSAWITRFGERLNGLVLAVHAAACWFNGESLEPVTYLPKHIITREDVDEFMPAQW